MNIKINLDPALKDLNVKWDLVLLIGGGEYRVRKLLPADVAALSNRDAMSDFETIEHVRDWFDDPKPGPDVLNEETLSPIATACLLYYQQTLTTLRMAALRSAVTGAVRQAISRGSMD